MPAHHFWGSRMKWAMLADKAKEPFDDPNRIFEWKFNGFRVKANYDGGPARLIGRSGIDYTAQFPEIHQVASRIKASQAEVDGEIVCLNPETGLPDFNRLQHRYGQRDPLAIKVLAEKYPATYMVFDVTAHNGRDLTARSADKANQMERKEILGNILSTNGVIKLSPWVDGVGIELYNKAKELRQEGIMAKTKTGLYYPDGRLQDWLKIKVPRRGYFVIGGYTVGTGWREELMGAVVLGLPTEQGLRWVGNAGTGFKLAQLGEVFSQLRKIETVGCPFVEGTKVQKLAAWVKPVLVALIEYGDTTNDGKLTWPSFQNMMYDLGPSDAKLEIEEVY